MLTRIYGLAFQTKGELKEYVRLREEAKARDHRKLGAECDQGIAARGVVGDDETGVALRLGVGRLGREEAGAALNQRHLARVCRTVEFAGGATLAAGLRW